jgi:hypothetical protein
MSQPRTEEEKVRIGFITLKDFERGYRGALLVTDQSGAPLEFRCTSAVSPTRVQRILYGKVLVPHIAVQLVGRPLFESMVEKPTILVAQDDNFLGLRDVLDQPVVCVRTQIGASTHSPDESNSPAPSQDSGGDPPRYAFEAHRRYHEDLDAARSMLSQCEDLLEPFERIEQALTADEERGGQTGG